MCKRYLVLRSADGGKEAETDDLAAAFKHGDDVIRNGGAGAHIFERISTARPEVASKWEGRRRPGAGS